MQIIKYNNNYKKEVEDIFKTYFDDPEFLQELDDGLINIKYSFYLILENGEVLGVAGIRGVNNFLSDYVLTSNPAELYIIASKYKGKGVGSKLLNYVIEECNKINYTELICYSPETHDSSWKFYQSNGFIKCGIVNDPDDGCPGMVWRRVL